jgi:hypothetical protein
MKLVAVALSILGMLLSSTSAMAEGPVPFSALMQTAGAQPDVPPMTDAAGKATPLSTPQAAPPHMTSGGKVMVGAGIGMVAIGGLVVMMTGLMHDWASPSRQTALYVGGGGMAAGGVTLIVFGKHRRE